MYEALGYSNFVEFLNDSEYAPMTKAQFYERKAIFDKEGGPVFDLLNSMGIPTRHRKLLGKGNVWIDGDNLVVKQDDSETTIEITDTLRLKEALIALADANADKSAKLDKQTAAITAHDEKTRELYDEIDRVRASRAADVNQDPHSLAIVNLTFAYRALVESVEAMNDIEREQFAPRDFELIAARNADLAAAFGRSDWTKIAGTRAPLPASDANGDADLDALINQALDDEDGNDAELAKSL